MQAPDKAPSAAAHAVIAFVTGLMIAFVPWACGAGAQLTPVNRCRLSALEILPKDPKMATVYDAVDVIERMLSCERDADGGP